MGARIMPGMFSMLGGSFASVVLPVIKILYRLPNEEWLDAGSLMSAFDAVPVLVPASLVRRSMTPSSSRARPGC